MVLVMEKLVRERERERKKRERKEQQQKEPQHGKEKKQRKNIRGGRDSFSWDNEMNHK